MSRCLRAGGAGWGGRRQRIFDGCGRRDMVQGSAAAQIELRDYCSGKEVNIIVAQVCVHISGGA